MAYSVTDRYGGDEDNPSVERMRAILEQLASREFDHEQAWLTHDSGWSLTATEDGRLFLENLDLRTAPRHMVNVRRTRILELWRRLAAGMIAEIENEPWSDGYGEPQYTAAEIAEHEAHLHAYEREVYDRFGPERAEPRCKEPGCSRGAVVASIFCRIHHYEAVRNRPCPFTH